ncbi:restriction endonuclease subunit S [Paracoccus sp. AK26]|uniref:restriction endonuclease subunit S n=1 Tax=Paracoccus sp. AK26 TaxID=2589076 RepID=UPI0014281DFB|nr:restriction endonuclease subunit S [Paracoccus sp. AK26]QIR84903.1 hypothetical protein FIU66_06580 [Paracoccus sp. AK26]
MPEVLPWPEVRLGDVCKVVRGSSPRPAGDPRYFGGDFIPWLTVAAITNVSPSQIVITETVGFLTEEGSRHSRHFQPGMVVIANSGWKCGVAKVLGFECCGNDGIAALESLTAADPLFLTYWINSQTERLRSQAAAGNEQPNLNTDRIAGLSLPLPVIAEQQAIAAALSDADGVVAGLERVIAKKRLIKQGAMQDLLTARRRLPGFSGDWEVKKLGELVTIIMGQSPSSTAYNSAGDGLPLIQGNADIKDRKAITRVFTRQVTKMGRAGDYLMTVRAPVGEIATTDMDVCLGRGVCALRTDQRIVYHIMVSKEPEWAKLSKGSTFDSVNGAEIRAFEVFFPADTAERNAVAQVLDDMDAEIQTLEARLAKARAVKEGMMQNLLTGRVRLV